MNEEIQFDRGQVIQDADSVTFVVATALHRSSYAENRILLQQGQAEYMRAAADEVLAFASTSSKDVYFKAGETQVKVDPKLHTPATLVDAWFVQERVDNVHLRAVLDPILKGLQADVDAQNPGSEANVSAGIKSATENLKRGLVSSSNEGRSV